MEATETKALVGLADRRFQSFSEAAEAVLAALEDVIPGTVMLGQFDLDEQICRVVEARGEGVNGMRRGTTLPLAAPPSAGGVGSGGAQDGSVDGLDGEHLLSLGVRTWLATPLEMSDGNIVGSLCAFETSSEAYRSDHAALLGVAARLLSYEWESVQRRAELRRLRDSTNGSDADPETGLPDRDSFLEKLEREWRLVERGTVQSVVVACRVGIDPAEHVGADAMTTLVLKDAAEALHATARTTDHVGRTGDATLAAILIGCQGEGARAFVQRFQAAVGRVTRSRPVPVEVACGFQPLAGTTSAPEALELADGAAGLQQGRPDE